MHGQGCAVAVSGGGDSVALLHLMVACGVKPHVLHFNHNWRPEAVQEAAFVEALAARYGLPFSAETWQNPITDEKAAREARYRFMLRTCQALGIHQLFIGHTLDDQAETFYMRLQRGSGVSGLAGMAANSTRGSISLMRPMLGISRAELRHWLAARGHHWHDDPSNTDNSFMRVRLRYSLAAMEAQRVGLSKRQIAQVCQAFGRLDALVEKLADRAAYQYLYVHPAGYAHLKAGWLNLPVEVAQRLVARALQGAGQGGLMPRLNKRLHLIDMFKNNVQKTTLGKCTFTLTGAGGVVVCPLQAPAWAFETRPEWAGFGLVKMADLPAKKRALACAGQGLSKAFSHALPVVVGAGGQPVAWPRVGRFENDVSDRTFSLHASG